MRYRVGRFTVYTGAKQASNERIELRTGCVVPESGIYRVLHTQHRLPEEVTLIKEHSFPRCSKCDDPVYFELVRSAPAAGNRSGFSVALYELPELTG